MIFKKKPPKETCFICGNDDLIENMSPAMVSYEESDGTIGEVEVGKICNKCSNILDELDEKYGQDDEEIFEED